MADPKIEIQENVALGALTTLAVPATARYLARAGTIDDIAEATAFAKERGLPLFPLGDGSNVLFGRDHFEGLVLRITIGGIEVVAETGTYSDVRVGAGENWDGFVQWAITRDLAGIESLTIVPGTVGAAPVQNVGCYGQEVSETIQSVETYDQEAGKLRLLTNADCQFRYRDSIFKRKEGQRYLITHVTFRLVPGNVAPTPQYASLQEELARRGITGRPTLRQIREALITVRTSKLADPAQIPTAGSFFHNPIISAEHYQQLVADYPDLPHYPTNDGHVKIPAAWLVEQAGFRGVEKDGVGMYEKQAVALINPGRRPPAEVLAFQQSVVDAVRQKFDITLRMEPTLVV